MGKVQLLFDGHVAETISPGLFKVLEPFTVDGVKWMEEHRYTGWTMWVLEGKAVAFATNDAGVFSFYEESKNFDITWDSTFSACGPICIGGLRL